MKPLTPFLIKASLALSLFIVSNPIFAKYTTPALNLNDGQTPSIQYHGQGKTSQPKVFILGGGPAFTSWNLEPIQQQVAQLGYFATLMDMQGLGENPQPNLDILNNWVKQIDRLKQQLSPNQPVVLIGHSWGAIMALLYTRQHPEAVSKLIFLNPVDPEKLAMQQLTEDIHERNGQENQTPQSEEDAWDNTVPEEIDINAITLRQIHQVLPTYFQDYQLGLTYAQQFTPADFSIDLNVNTWKEYDLNPVAYNEIPPQIPKYFLECTQDYLMPYNLNAMQAHWTFKQKAIFDGCGHFPWIEKPALFKNALQQFLED